MNNLSLYILDIVQNSLKARATDVIIKINEDLKRNILEIQVIDNGIGIEEENISKVTDPFYTTRDTRKVGLGLPFFKEVCENCNGSLKILSSKNQGTSIIAQMDHNHINRLPLGEMEETIYTLLINDENAEIEYIHTTDNKQFKINSKEINSILDGVSLKQYEIMKWIKGYILMSLLKIKEEDQ